MYKIRKNKNEILNKQNKHKVKSNKDKSTTFDTEMFDYTKMIQVNKPVKWTKQIYIKSG